jgi:hypothetical protein
MPAKIESYANQTNDVKNSVRAATVENITLSGLIVLDGISLSENDRVLVKNQTISSNNGVYTVKSGSWTRSNDANSSSKVSSGMLVLVEEGSVNADTAWILSTNNPITLDTSPLSFIKFSPTEIKTELIPGEAINFDYNPQTDALTISAEISTEVIPGEAINFNYNQQTDVLTISAEINTEVIPGEGINFNYNEQTDVLTISSTTTNASNLTSGTLSDSRLSSEVALYSAINAYNSGPPSGFDIYPRGEAANISMALAAGGVYFTFFTPVSTITVSSITMVSGNGAVASGITLARMGLYTFDETTAVLVARTASDTTLFSTINTAYNRNFSTVGGYPASYQLTAGIRYGVAIIFVGTQGPTGVGRTNSPGFSIQTPRTTGNVGSQSDLPTTASSFGIQQGAPFARIS